MQISNQEVSRVREAVRKPHHDNAEAPVKSVEELAARYGIRTDEVRKAADVVRMSEEDPFRERRVRELARRIAEGTYNIDSDQLLDMAERRAVADRSKDL